MNSLLLGMMVLVYSWLIAMNLTGRGDCGIVPSGGPGTISQLGFGFRPSYLNRGSFEAGEGKNNGLGSIDGLRANEYMMQDDGSTSQELNSAPPSNTE